MSQISNNSDFLQTISDWLDKQASAQKRKIAMTENERLHDSLINNQENKLEDAKYYLKQLWHTGGLGVIKIFHYLSTLTNIGLVDNKVLRYLESVYKHFDKNDNKFIDWVKKHPSVSSYLSYYLAIALIGTVTFGAVKNSSKNKDSKEQTEQKSDVEIDSNTSENNAPENTPENNASEYVSKMYDITDKNFVNTFISENWQDIVISALEFETYYGVSPTKNDYESVHTYGPGLTYVYIKNDKGDYTGHLCKGKYAEMAMRFSTEQIWEQFKIHISIRGGTLDKIRKKLNSHKIKEISANQMMALFIAGYQRPKDINGIIEKISKAKTLKEQCDAFAYYKIEKTADKKFIRGTMKRRWWCAAYFADIINSTDLLSMECDVFAKASLNILYDKENKHFIFDEEAIEHALLSQFSEYDKSVLKDRKLFVGTVEDFIKQNKIFDNVNNSKTEQSKVIAFHNASNRINSANTYDATHLFTSTNNYNS